MNFAERVLLREKIDQSFKALYEMAESKKEITLEESMKWERHKSIIDCAFSELFHERYESTKR